MTQEQIKREVGKRTVLKKATNKKDEYDTIQIGIYRSDLEKIIKHFNSIEDCDCFDDSEIAEILSYMVEEMRFSS